MRHMTYREQRAEQAQYATDAKITLTVFVLTVITLAWSLHRVVTHL